MNTEHINSKWPIVVVANGPLSKNSEIISVSKAGHKKLVIRSKKVIVEYRKVDIQNVLVSETAVKYISRGRQMEMENLKHKVKVLNSIVRIIDSKEGHERSYGKVQQYLNLKHGIKRVSVTKMETV